MTILAPLPLDPSLAVNDSYTAMTDEYWHIFAWFLTNYVYTCFHLGVNLTANYPSIV